MITIFQSITLEGWVDVMYTLGDGGNVLGAPGLGIVFQVTTVLLGALIIMNLFLAVIADNFNFVESDEPPETVDLDKTGSQGREQTLARAVAEIRHTNPLRSFCLRLCTHTRFDKVVIGCILLNLVVMMLEFSPMQPDRFVTSGASDLTDYVWPAYFWFLFAANGTLTVAFVIEAGIKLLGLGPRLYIRDEWNIFDFMVVLMSSLELCFDIFGQLGLMKTKTPALSPLRALRILRVLKLICAVERLRKTVRTLGRSLASVFYLLLLLVLFMVIFSLFGMELFAGYYPKPWFNQNWTAANYPCAFAEMRSTWANDDPYPPNNFDTSLGRSSPSLWFSPARIGMRSISISMLPHTTTTSSSPLHTLYEYYSL